MNPTAHEAGQQADDLSNPAKSLARIARWRMAQGCHWPSCRPWAGGANDGRAVKMTSQETYSAATEIAPRLVWPIKTVRKHILTLDARGWIENRADSARDAEHLVGRLRWRSPRRLCGYRRSGEAHISCSTRTAVVGVLQRPQRRQACPVCQGSAVRCDGSTDESESAVDRKDGTAWTLTT